MADTVIELLSDHHDTQSFDCGIESLNTFITTLATQYHRRNIGRTWVLTQPPAPEVLAYYTLSNGALQPGTLPANYQKKLPRRLPIPTMHIGRLAVDVRQKGRGLGRHMLLDALHQTWLQSKRVGIYAVEVRAIDDAARSFYAKFGFGALVDDPLHMCLPVAALEELFNV